MPALSHTWAIPATTLPAYRELECPASNSKGTYAILPAIYFALHD